MPKVLCLQSCFYLGADGHHVHLEADAEASVPSPVALELAQCGRVLYADAADVPEPLQKAAKRFTVSDIVRRAVRDRETYRKSSQLPSSAVVVGA